MRRRHVTLSDWPASDSPAWLGEAWSAAGLARPPDASSLCDRPAKLEALRLDGDIAGVAAIFENQRCVAAIALREGLRGYGYGGEAVRLLQEEFGVTQALVSPKVGLALYFWLRLGYAPADHQPYAPNAVLMERTNRDE